VTMGCGEQCPIVPGAIRYDWPLDDPGGKSIEQVRNIRDAIQQRVLELLTHQQWLRLDRSPDDAAQSTT
jgi:arsenate reductase (thioredoxin)